MTSYIHKPQHILHWLVHQGCVERAASPFLCPVLWDKGWLALSTFLLPTFNWLHQQKDMSYLPQHWHSTQCLMFLGPLEVLRSPVVYSNHYKSMLSKDWTDLSRHGATRNWPKDGISPSPFHRGRKASIRNMLPSGGVKTIRIDLAHTYAIAGWGKEQVASLLVLVAVRCSLFGNGGYEDQLKWAFDSFSGWCQLHSKTSTIHEFSKKELKISSLLEQTIYWDFIVVIFLISTCHHSSLIPKSQLRLQKYPRGLGKGSDCALVGGWLESILTPLDPATVPASCRHFWVYRPPKNMWLFFWHPFWGLKFFKCMGSPYLVSDILVTSNPSHVCISPILCVTPDNRTTI